MDIKAIKTQRANPTYPVAEFENICFISSMMSAIQDTKTTSHLFHQLPAKKQLDAIINHPTPLKIVREMPTPDLLFIIREVGAESSLELVEMMHPRQIQELFDLEVWSHDQINTRALGHYFALLFEANPETAVSQIHSLDIELIGVMFKMATAIFDLSCGEDIEDYPELYSISPDGRFLVCFSSDESMKGLSQMLHTFLDQLYGRDMSFALRLLESLRFELISGLEEQSLRWRQNRLADLGILPHEERLEFFSSVTLSDIKSVAHHVQQSMPAEIFSPFPVSLTKKTSVDEYGFLKAALDGTSEQENERFKAALVHVIANMHASLSGDFGDKDAMMQTSNYVKFLAETGLFQACNGSIEKACDTLARYPAKFLVRLGRTALTNLRKRLLSQTKNSASLFGKDFCYLDSPLRETARALVLPEPRFYEGLSSAKKLVVRFFTSLSELNATISAVNEILFRARFIGADGLGFTEHMLNNAPLSHANILARTLINSFLGRDNLLADIGINDVDSVFAGSEIKPEFETFVDTAITDYAQRLAAQSQDHEHTTLERAQQFKRAVLIQLTQNRAMVLA